MHSTLLSAAVSTSLSLACASTSPAPSVGQAPGSAGSRSEVSEPSKPGPSGTLESKSAQPKRPSQSTRPPERSGPLSPEVRAALEHLFPKDLRVPPWASVPSGQHEALATLAASGDPRLGWILSDQLRMETDAARGRAFAAAAADLLGLELDPRNPWNPLTNQLITWDFPAPPGYLEFKRRIFTRTLPGWDELFRPGAIDWRHVTWGGVRIDDRPYGETDAPCNCIPAADAPAVTGLPGAGWLESEDVVFGVEVNGAFRAYPRRIMEVREMVLDTLGGRPLGMPYCTLCASAQAFLLDELPAGVARPVLRTSGLLIRSNKVMFDLNTGSIFDTFRGVAVTGPLADAGVRLPEVAVVTTTWGEWSRAHPDTTVLGEELALGRDFDFRNGRDARGPIFPIGEVDPRLSVHRDVLGIVTAAGHPVAFPVDLAQRALRAGDPVGFEEVHVVLAGGGLRAVGPSGEALGSHQAFWFAWSQFHPDTRLWMP